MLHHDLNIFYIYKLNKKQIFVIIHEFNECYNIEANFKHIIHSNYTDISILQSIQSVIILKPS